MDAADKAQAQAEWLEQYRAAHRRKHVMRASDFCIDCHEAIEPARLKAEPTATRCVYCQTEHERLDMQYGNT
jgi:phage/conjugal plasmid C-4 type zinc finger TraR family protein